MTFTVEQIPVKIIVQTTIRNGQEKETYELTTFGQYFKKRTSIYLRYDEYMEEEKIQTTIKLSDQEGSILRNGAVKMRLPFQKEKRISGNYETPYGIMEINTFTTRINHEFNETQQKGTIEILYDLTIQGSHSGTYHLLIHFEEDIK